MLTIKNNAASNVALAFGFILGGTYRLNFISNIFQ